MYLIFIILTLDNFLVEALHNRLRWERSRGSVLRRPGSEEVTLEDVRKNWENVGDMTNAGIIYWRKEIYIFYKYIYLHIRIDWYNNCRIPGFDQPGHNGHCGQAAGGNAHHPRKPQQTSLRHGLRRIYFRRTKLSIKIMKRRILKIILSCFYMLYNYYS